MSLLDNARKEAAIETPATEGTPVAKKHNNSEYQKRQREHQYKAACAIRDFIKAQGITLPADLQAEMDFLTKEKKASAAGSAFGKPVLYKIFGNTPKKGDSVTALKVFEETGKGFAEMRQLMKKWAEKQNVTVKYDEAKKAYVVDSDVPAYTEA